MATGSRRGDGDLDGVRARFAMFQTFGENSKSQNFGFRHSFLA